MYHTTLGHQRYTFDSLRTLLAKASPARSGDYLAGVAAMSAEERMAARMTLAAVPLKTFLQDLLIPYEQDEVTRLIVYSHDKQAFEPISHLTVGDFRNWLLSDTTSSELLTRVAPGITPEMAAAYSAANHLIPKGKIFYTLKNHTNENYLIPIAVLM